MKMHEVGFEPTKHMQQILSLPPLTTRESMLYTYRNIFHRRFHHHLPLPHVIMKQCLYIDFYIDL